MQRVLHLCPSRPVAVNLKEILMKRSFSFSSLAVALCLLAAPVSAAELKSFTATGGPMGGDFYTLAGVVAEKAKTVLPGVTVSVSTGGAVENLPKMNMGKAEVGTTMAKLYGEALSSTGSYEGKPKMTNVKAMMYLTNIPMSFFLVREDSPIKSIAEIKEKKLKVRLLSSKKGSSPATAAENMLKHYGISFDDIRAWGGSVSFVSYSEASSLIQDGHADVFVGPMVSSINELVTTMKMKMLPIDPAVLEKLKAEGYVTFVMPKDKYYFVKEDTPHMAEAIILAVRGDLPDDVIYNLTKAISEDPDAIRNVHQTYSIFDPKKAPVAVGGPLHPGAIKYYKEKGLL